jgi:signal transduction histidine kinase
VRRIRIVFALLAVALLVPTGLLVRRALESVEVERAARHRTVAERVFDEMERSLSEFLSREEERPFGQYRFYVTPEGAVRGALARSPLADPPDRDFVVGYFQVDPDGSVHSPLRPRDEEAARAAGDYRPTAAALGSAAATLRVVTAYWAARPLSAPESAAPADQEQPPGTTVSLLDDREGARLGHARELERGETQEAEPRKEEFASAYDAIQSLNRGALGRASRSQKVVKRAPLQELPAQASAPEQRARADASATEAQVGVGEMVAQGAPPRTGTIERKAELDFAEEPSERRMEGEGAVALRGVMAPVPAPARRKTVRIALDPLIGRAVDERHLLLYRTVLVDDQGYRQGLVIDLPKLSEFLRRETLGDRALPRANLAFTTQLEEAIPGDPGGSYAYRHRFAEPFDDLAVGLQLAPLADGSGVGSVYLLSVLLLLAGSAGLFALYRMVGVTVGFAERRNNFVAAVSHELKTPLTAIRMYAEMLRDGIVPSEHKRQEYYGTITSESERLSRLINNVLEFSRLEKGTRQMNLVVGSLGPVVEEMAELLRPHAEREGFTLQVEADPELPPVRYDRDALLQVLFNLVDNAIKYTRDAPQRLISLECRRREGGVAVLVRDRGPGVAPRHLTRLFEPFFRGETELTRRTKGTGIGLALVKGLVERMDAGVSGRNAEGGGFEVSIDFRAAPA